MKKIIIVAGSCNTGKTSTTNALIKELINDGYEVDCLNGSRFWEKWMSKLEYIIIQEMLF